MADETAVALLLTLLSACAVNWGYLTEHQAASVLPELSPRHPFRSARLLVRSSHWLLGFTAETTGFALYVVALALAPLALVQAVAAGGIGVLALLVSRTTGRRLDVRERIGVVVAVGGLMLLGISLAGGSEHGSSASWAAIALWLAASTGGAVAAVTLSWGRAIGGAAWGLAAGILFAAGDVATKVMVSGGGGAAIAPAMILFYGAGTLFLQTGFQRGRPLTTAGIATLATNAIPIAAAMTLFQEPLPGGVLGIVRVAAFAAVVAGAVALSPRRAAAMESAREGEAPLLASGPRREVVPTGGVRQHGH